MKSGLKSKLLPAAVILLWWLTLLVLGVAKMDHFVVGVIMLTLYYGGPKLRSIRDFMLPLALTAASYDGLRYLLPLVRGSIRVEEPYQFDKSLFGITVADGRVLTPNEWWQLHTHWALDLLTGFFYLTFLALFILTAAYFRVWVRDRKLAPFASMMTWGFFWLNWLGYVTYALFPAAPPWYVATHGFGPADLNATPSPAGALRFDRLLDTNFFVGMYGKTASVFGAVPSLHVAYPMLAIYFAFRLKKARVWSVTFFAIMAFSAVYLNHHYLLDVIWGAAYALLVGYAMDRYASRQVSAEASRYLTFPIRF